MVLGQAQVLRCKEPNLKIGLFYLYDNTIKGGELIVIELYTVIIMEKHGKLVKLRQPEENLKSLNHH